MANDNINYINVNPYIYDLDFNDMIDRFLNSNILINDNDNDNAITRTFILNFMKKYKYIYVKKTNDSQNIDKIISKKILYYLDQFFKKKHTNKKRKQNNNILKNKTLKKIIH